MLLFHLVVNLIFGCLFIKFAYAGQIIVLTIFSVFKVQLKNNKNSKIVKKVISNNEFLFEYTQEGDKCLVCHDSYSMESSRNYQNQQGDIISMVFFYNDMNQNIG